MSTDNKTREDYIEIPIAYIETDSGLDYDFDYMRILFERKLELMVHGVDQETAELIRLEYNNGVTDL